MQQKNLLNLLKQVNNENIVDKKGNDVTKNIVEITEQPKTKIDIDFKLATIRRDCMQMANHPDKPVDEIISNAQKMYDFITGKEVIAKEPEPKQEWK